MLNNLTIALDVMGGDQGPHVTISAALLAVNHLPHLHLILCGDSSVIAEQLEKQHFSAHPQISFILSISSIYYELKN